MFSWYAYIILCVICHFSRIHLPVFKTVCTLYCFIFNGISKKGKEEEKKKQQQIYYLWAADDITLVPSYLCRTLIERFSCKPFYLDRFMFIIFTINILHIKISYTSRIFKKSLLRSMKKSLLMPFDIYKKNLQSLN